MTGNDSTAGGTALERCAACSSADFAERVWGREPLLSKAIGAFTDLLDPAAVDELVSRRGLRTPFLRMAKDGTLAPDKSFTRGGGAGAGIADQAADDKILAAVADGSTLVLQALHRTWPPLVDFGTRLADELGHPVQINAYITPPQNQGFAPHYDVHDVFVLQVAGRKHWTIHEPVLDAPLASQPWDQRKDAVAARAADEPVIDTVLEPGDALYLPRGTIHSAQALGETSIHLTVGVHPVTRYHLVEHLLATLVEHADLRTALPAGVDLADPAVLAPHLAATVEALTAALADPPLAPVARRVGSDLMRRTRPEPIGPLAQLTAADALEPGTPLRLRRGLRLRLDETGPEIKIVLLDRTVTVPGAVADAVKLVVSGAPVTAGELPGLDAADQLVFARRLLREGILVVQ